jgi:CheY-like chemotaxis protein
LPTVAIYQPVAKTEPTIIGFTGKTPTLLIIDDQRENRLVLIDLLTPLGFNVIEAENGTLGITKAREVVPDLILLDLVMPEMNGFETARRLRSLPELRQVAIIAISASVFDYYQQESLMVGCNAFLSNPIQVPLLLQLLGEYLKISFVYEEDSNDSVKETMPFIGPSVQQAEMLLDFALKGDIAEILKELEILEKQEPPLTPFVNQIRQLAKSFQEEQICELLESFITKDVL